MKPQKRPRVMSEKIISTENDRIKRLEDDIAALKEWFAHQATLMTYIGGGKHVKKSQPKWPEKIEQ